MLCSTHSSEASALDHKSDLQYNEERFVAVVESAERIGDWLVLYDEIGTPIDRNAIKVAQAIF